MPLDKIGILMSADPDAARQEQEIANREMLAKLLLRNSGDSGAINPSPTGAALTAIGNAVRQGFGTYMLGKSMQQRGDLAQRQADVMQQIMQQGFGDQQVALPGPAFATADTPDSAYTPFSGDLSTGQAQVEPVTKPGSLVIPGMDSRQALQAYLLDPKGYMSALSGTYASNAQTPDAVKVMQWQGVTPEQSRNLWMANQLKDATQSYGPNTTVIPPNGNPFMTPSAAPPGGMTVITSQGPQVVPVPNAAAVNAGYVGAEEEAKRRAAAQNTMVTTLGPDGRPVATRQSDAYGRPTAMSPYEESGARSAGEAEFQTVPVYDPVTKVYRYEKRSRAPGQIQGLGPMQTKQETLPVEIMQERNKVFNEKVWPSVNKGGDAGRDLRDIAISLRKTKPWTGPLAESIGVPTAKIQAILGFDSRLTEYQQFNAAIAKRLFDMTLDPELSGTQTEGDAQRFMATLPTLGSTPKAKAFIEDFMEASANRLLRRRDYFADQMEAMQQAGRYDLNEIERRWTKIDRSLWDDPVMEKWR